jgi:hypothetical protein
MADFWNVENPDKPWGKFDPNAQLSIPFDWIEWLADLGVNYASHEIIVEAPLEVVGSAQVNGVIVAFLKVADGQEVAINKKYSVTCRIVTDGNPPHQDDRTVFLKMVQR